MTFVLTGSTGFIGSEVLLRLLSSDKLPQSAKILCLVRRKPDFNSGLLAERFANAKGLLNRVEFITCNFQSDLIFQATLNSLDAQSPIVIHMAALIALSSKEHRSFAELEVEQNRINIGVTQDLLQFCRQRSGSFIFTSSVVAFGATQKPTLRFERDFASFDPICRSFSYYRSKREAHEFVLSSAGQTPVRVLCPGIVHGALDGYKNSRAHLKMLIEGQLGLVPWGSGNFVGLDRVAAAHVDAAFDLAQGAKGIETRLSVDENLSFYDYLRLYLEVFCQLNPNYKVKRVPRQMWAWVSTVALKVIVLLSRLGLRTELGFKVAQASMHLVFKSEHPQAPTKGLRASLVDSIATQKI